MNKILDEIIKTHPKLIPKIYNFRNKYNDCFNLFVKLRYELYNKNFDINVYKRKFSLLKNDILTLYNQISIDNKEFDFLFRLNYLILEVNGDLLLIKLKKNKNIIFNNKIENYVTLFNIIQNIN